MRIHQAGATGLTVAAIALGLAAAVLLTRNATELTVTDSLLSAIPPARASDAGDQEDGTFGTLTVAIVGPMFVSGRAECLWEGHVWGETGSRYRMFWWGPGPEAVESTPDVWIRFPRSGLLELTVRDAEGNMGWDRMWITVDPEGDDCERDGVSRGP